jgi:hypothetical protein
MHKVAKLVPWYHAPLERCKVLTTNKERCTFSARYLINGPGAVDMPCCKCHADILGMEPGYAVTVLHARRITVER